jgi:hypothetical protein
MDHRVRLRMASAHTSHQAKQVVDAALSCRRSHGDLRKQSVRAPVSRRARGVATGTVAFLGVRGDWPVFPRLAAGYALRRKIVARHIVCLTFDFDTQSGFIARGHENVDAALKNGASCQSWCANIPPRIGITAVLHTWAPIASTTRNRMTRQARTSGVPSRLRSKKRVGRERERCSFDSLLQNIGDSNHRSGKSITVNF